MRTSPPRVTFRPPIHRFYVAPEDWHSDALSLTGSEAHHCRTVLRLEPSDKIVLFDGRGREVTAEIVNDLRSWSVSVAARPLAGAIQEEISRCPNLTFIEGDLLARLLVEVPSHLNSEQRQKLEEFSALCGDENTPLRKSFFDRAKEFFR